VNRPVVIDRGPGIVRSCSPAAVGHHTPRLTARNVYKLDHLATFTATGSASGRLLTPPEGVRRVRELAFSGFIWPLRVHVVIGNHELVVIDLQSGEEMEHFPLSLVSQPTCATAVDRRVNGCEVLDNLVLFTVLEDPVKKTSPPEIHVFQCVSRPVSDTAHVCYCTVITYLQKRTIYQTVTDRIEQCFTSPPTQYRLCGRRFLQVKRPNQHYQSTEGTNSTQTNQTYNKQT